jgi:hypothetical protein
MIQFKGTLIITSVTALSALGIFCSTLSKFTYSDNELMLDVNIQPYRLSLRGKVGQPSPTQLPPGNLKKKGIAKTCSSS